MIVAALSLGLVGATMVIAPTPAGAVSATSLEGTVRTETGAPANAAFFDPDAPVTTALQQQVAGQWQNVPVATQDHTFNFGSLEVGSTYRVTVSTPGSVCGGNATAAFTVSAVVIPEQDLRISCDYKPLDTPIRVLETRPGPTFDTEPDSAVKVGPNTITPARVVQSITGIPHNAQAVALTVTGTGSTANDNYLTVWDCSDKLTGEADLNPLEPDPPYASNVNLGANDTRANAVVTGFANSGAFDNNVCIYSRRDSHLIVDVTGWFPRLSLPAGADPLPANGQDDYNVDPNGGTRILDTRPDAEGVKNIPPNSGGSPIAANQTIQVDANYLDGLTGGTESILINLAGVDPVGGYLTVWDCTDTKPGQDDFIEPDPPLTSALNLEPGLVAANLVNTKVDASLKFCVYSSKQTHLVIDRVGFFPSGAHFTETAPTRVMETRNGGTTPNGDTVVQIPGGAGNGKLAANETRVLDLTAHVPANTKAVLLNMTGTNSATGYVTVFPCDTAGDPRPVVSNLNLASGQTRANLVISAIGPNREVCIYSQNGTDLVVDLTGYFGQDPA